MKISMKFFRCCSATVILLVAACKPKLIPNSSSITSSIKDLAAQDFRKARTAQITLIDCGEAAIPELKQAFNTATNEQQIALCAYAISEISTVTYSELLLSSNAVDNLCAIEKYFNKTAFAKLHEDQREKVIERFKHLESGRASDKQECLTRLLKQMSE